MVLHHVAQRAGGLVIARAILQPDRLGDRDLDVVDPARVPHRLEQRIAEAQRQDVLDRFLAQIMVDAERPLLGKGGGDRVVDLAARRQIVAERLFEPDPHGVAGQPDRLRAP